jgi:HEAT repeat protein
MPIALAVVLAAADWVVGLSAWASPFERIMLMALSLNIVSSALLLVALMRRPLPRWALLAVTMLVAALVVMPLARTHTARAWLGGAAWIVLTCSVSITYLGIAHTCFSGGRVTRATFVCASVLAIAAAALLPRHLAVTLRPLMIVGAAGVLGLMPARVEARRRPVAAVTLAGVLATVLLTFGLSHNARLVAHDQLPVTGLILRAAEALRGAEQPAAIASTRDLSTHQDPEAPLAGAHLLLITIDALRADAIGAYGAKRVTPSMDRLAAGGWRYERAYAAEPRTAYSLAALLSAQPVSRVRQTPAPPTMADHLRAKGFHTEAWYPEGLFFDGRNELSGYEDSHFGFAHADVEGRDAHAVTDAALRRIERLRLLGEPRSMFWVHYFDPHEPYEDRDGRTGRVPRLRYLSEVAAVDVEIGRLIAATERLSRPTLVVLTADHGEEFGEHGGFYHGSSLYEEQIRVPLIIAAPGLAAREIDTPIGLIDALPIASSLLGVGFSPRAEAADVTAEVFTKRMLVRGRHKLIHDDRGHFDELYDLRSDPEELRNLADRHTETALELHVALERAFGLAPVERLAETLADTSNPPEERAAAAQQLGRDRVKSAAHSLHAALRDSDQRVRAEAAVALGELRDPRAIIPLTLLLDTPRWRHKAAVVLGKLGEKRAVPALIEALTDEDVALRRRATHVLGLVGDAMSASRLMAAVEDLRIRADAYVALGRIAERITSFDIVEFLIGRLDAETQDDARAHLVWALGLAGNPRAIAAIVREARRPSAAPAIGETLVRLGALHFGAIGGVNFSPGVLPPDVASCARRESNTLVQYAGSTSCVMRGKRMQLEFHSPRHGAVLSMLRARRTVDGVSEVRVVVNGRQIAVAPLSDTFREARFPVPQDVLRAGRNELMLTADGPGVEIDHLLLLPPASDDET